MSDKQGPAGRDFQLSGISGSGIAKNFGFGSGIGYICKKKLSIGYFRVLKILIGYFRVHPNIAQFLYDMLIYVTDFSHFLRRDVPFHLKVSLAPLAQRQYMVFTVVSFEWVNKDTNEKYLLNSQSCLQNLRGGHIENVIFLVWLLLFCVNVFFFKFILVSIIGHHWSLGLLDIWNSCRTLKHSRLNLGWMDAWVGLDWIGWLWHQEHRSRAMLITNMVSFSLTCVVFTKHLNTS